MLLICNWPSRHEKKIQNFPSILLFEDGIELIEWLIYQGLWSKHLKDRWDDSCLGPIFILRFGWKGQVGYFSYFRKLPFV